MTISNGSLITGKSWRLSKMAKNVTIYLTSKELEIIEDIKTKSEIAPTTSAIIRSALIHYHKTKYSGGI